MTDDTFRPESARSAARDAANEDPARAWLEETVARPEPWPEPRPATRDQPQPELGSRRGRTGDVLRGAANLAVTAYFVDQILTQDEAPAGGGEDLGFGG